MYDYEKCEYILINGKMLDENRFLVEDKIAFHVLLNLLFERNCKTNSLESSYHALSIFNNVDEYRLKKALFKLKDEGFIEIYKSDGRGMVIIALRRNDDWYKIGSYELYLDDNKVVNTKNRVSRNDKGYEKFRKRVLERDNYTCQKCGSKEDLVVHHIKSYEKYPYLRTTTSNGVTLCRRCHGSEHKKGG